jgi:hypothetical protein
MRPSDSSGLPVEHRMRANWTAAVVGLSAFPLASFALIGPQAHPSGFLILMFITGLTAVAGFAAAWNNYPGVADRVDLLHSVRRGVRSAWLAAPVAAGMTMLAARSFGAPFAPFAIFLPCLLSILPANFVGMLMAAFAASLQVRRDSSRNPVRYQNSGDGFQTFLVVTSLAGFMSVLAPQRPPLAESNDSAARPHTSSNRRQISNLAYGGPTTPPSTQFEEYTPEPSATLQPIHSETPYARYSPADPSPSDTPHAPSARPYARHSPVGATISETPFEQSSASDMSMPPNNTEHDVGQISESDPMYQAIFQFVVAHHKKINRGTVDMVASDYADRVTYFNHGDVDRAFVYRDEAASRSKFLSWSEVIMQPVKISACEPGDYAAEYQIVYDATKRNGQHITGVSSVHLLMKRFPDGLKIVSQRSG